MQFTEILRHRRMVRSYTSEPVSDDVLRRVMECVNKAPSAGFSQGFHIVVVRNQELRNKAADIAEVRYVDLGFPRWIAQAPVHIYVGIREDSYRERYSNEEVRSGWDHIPWPVPFWWFDGGALFMLLQLAALNEGLATGIFSSVYTDELAALGEVVGFSADIGLAGVLTIGHQDHQGPHVIPPNAVFRKPLSDLVRWLD
jgi:FMN reductase [NAD(P)H]